MPQDKTKILKHSSLLISENAQLHRLDNLYHHERSVWSQLLHDEFGQSLAAIKSFSIGIQRSNDCTDETAEIASLIETTANELYNRCYDMMSGLRSSLNNKTRLIDNIRNCLDNSRIEQRGIKIILSDKLPDHAFSELINMFITRIFQDTLSGILRNTIVSDIYIDLTSISTQHIDTSSDNSEIELTISCKIQPDSTLNLCHDFILAIRNYARSFDAHYLTEQIDSHNYIFRLKLNTGDLNKDNP